MISVPAGTGDISLKIAIFYDIMQMKKVLLCLKTNQGEALYIIRSLSAVYHQHEVLYIIKSQEYAPSVMIYTYGDDIHAKA